MRFEAVERFRRAARRFRAQLGPTALILLYHRVASLPADPYLLCVTPARFAEHLAVLRQRYQVIPLGRLAQALGEGNLPRRTVVITFDDGYADNLYNAKPLLEGYDLPATVFAATGYVEQGREFWWDELERLLLEPRQLPPALRLPLDRCPGHWQLGGAAVYDEETWRLQRAWDVEQKDAGARQRVFRDLYEALFPLPRGKQQRVLEELRRWAGAERLCRPTHRPLARQELVDLADGGLVSIGAHTATHPVLSSLPAILQRDEIRGSKARLEEILGHPITSFAYPYGLRSTYRKGTVAAVREAGFDCACSNFPELVGRGTDRFQLPRLVVRDWDGDAFDGVLDEWLGN